MRASYRTSVRPSVRLPVCLFVTLHWCIVSKRRKLQSQTFTAECRKDSGFLRQTFVFASEATSFERGRQIEVPPKSRYFTARLA